MCGYASTETGYKSLVANFLEAAQRNPGMFDYYMTQARSAVWYAQRNEGWLMNYDPVTCTKKDPAPPLRPRDTPGMKVVREAVREATITPEPPAPTREKTKQLAA